LSFVFILLLGCGGGEEKVDIPEDVIGPDSMVPILVDFHLAEGAILEIQKQKQSAAQPAANYYAAILKKHGIDREKFDRSLQFYSNYPALYIQIYDEVLAELNKKEAASLQ
jgi:hypothetical protein